MENFKIPQYQRAMTAMLMLVFLAGVSFGIEGDPYGRQIYLTDPVFQAISSRHHISPRTWYDSEISNGVSEESILSRLIFWMTQPHVSGVEKSAIYAGNAAEMAAALFPEDRSLDTSLLTMLINIEEYDSRGRIAYTVADISGRRVADFEFHLEIGRLLASDDQAFAKFIRVLGGKLGRNYSNKLIEAINFKSGYDPGEYETSPAGADSFIGKEARGSRTGWEAICFALLAGLAMIAIFVRHARSKNK